MSDTLQLERPHISSGDGDMKIRLAADLRAAGLRPVQIWVPDVRAADLVEEARRQSRRASMHAGEREALDVIERLADLDDDPS